MIVPTAIIRLGARRVAVEPELADRLRALQSGLQPHFRRITVIAPTGASADYEGARDRFAIIDEGAERISLVAAHPAAVGAIAFWLRHFLPNLVRIAAAVRRSAFVQASTSAPGRPFEIVGLLLAAWWRRPRACVEEFDRPEPSTPQLRLAVRCSSMVLLPSQRQAQLAARRGADIRSFVRCPVRAEWLIETRALERKLASLRAAAEPLRLACFAGPASGGGVEHALEALAMVWRAGATAFRLRVIGSGDDEARLRRLAGDLDLQDVVEFTPGGGEQLRDCHLLLATPQQQWTPALALRAMAAGVPVLAFDLPVYADLQGTGAVTIVPTLAIEALAARVAGFVRGKGALSHMVRAAVAFARGNTRTVWSERRVRWTLELLGLAPLPPRPTPAAPASPPAAAMLDAVAAPFDSGASRDLPVSAALPAMPAAPGSSRSTDRLP